jgi:hypothetical protein
MKTTRIIMIALATFLSACTLSPEQAAIDKAIVEANTEQITVKSEAAVEIAGACETNLQPMSCDGIDPNSAGYGFCAASANQAIASMSREKSECVQAVAQEAGKAATGSVTTRYDAYSSIAESVSNGLVETVKAVVPFAINRDVQRTARTMFDGARDIFVEGGRPNIDNSVVTNTTTTTTRTEDNDTTITEDNDTAVGDTTVVGRDNIGRDSAGRDITGGNRDDSICREGDDCRNNSPGDQNDEQDNSNEPPDDDGTGG